MTNNIPIGPYRGAGRPEAAYMLERMMDHAARELGIDRIELRGADFFVGSGLQQLVQGGDTKDPTTPNRKSSSDDKLSRKLKIEPIFRSAMEQWKHYESQLQPLKNIVGKFSE